MILIFNKKILQRQVNTLNTKDILGIIVPYDQRFVL